MHKPILRRVGLVLLLASLLQLAWTAYLATLSHSFSFDFTFLVAGIAMMFGSLSYAHYVRPLSAFVAGALLTVAVHWIATEPLSALMGEMRVHMLQALGDLVSYVLMTLLAVWTARELSRPEIADDPANPMTFWTTPWVAFAGGIALCSVVFLLGHPEA
ncbi:hypothetical protein [Dongia sedimenti]|uniref:Uncharacterized protein n=1 Tax=Dongia sedimenti TaxID=3064282 RepID=A0ABU0YQU3_9PROT|nr:hypothetical protein [Rhodospirillaceae bacterium R-7]